jgi:hypothetical protein
MVIGIEQTRRDDSRRQPPCGIVITTMNPSLCAQDGISPAILCGHATPSLSTGVNTNRQFGCASSGACSIGTTLPFLALQNAS